MAKLYFKYSAMNAGKTTILLQAAHNYEEQGMKVLVIKPMVDTKGEDKIVSRLGIERTVDYRISKDQNVYDFFEKKLDDISCILVDEAQFLGEKQIDDLRRIVCDFDIPVICYGLRTDFKTKGFPGSTRLLEIADKIEELKTMYAVRKALSTAQQAEVTEDFISEVMSTKNNAELVERLGKIFKD